MKYLFKGKNERGHDFWMSYTDLMCGFLIIFIIASILSNRDAVRTYKQLQEFQGRMVNMNQEFDAIFPESEGCKVIDSLDCIRIYPIGEQDLFLTNDDTMNGNLRNRLVYKQMGRRFVQKAMALVREGKNIKEIRIEGHADTRGDYMKNLRLSSNRAYAVYKCIHDDCGLNSKEVQFVEQHMIAVGYSTAKPVIENGVEDINKSRRVEFKIIGEGFATNK